MAHSALKIAQHFLSISDEDSGELISNLKLQKLLYYAQGYAVAMNGTPLFLDKLYAWKHGPVVKTVYNYYSRYGDGALPRSIPPKLPSDVENFLNEIYRVFGRFSAWALRDMTHREDPWLLNYKPNVLNIEIPVADLEKFFKKNVEAQK